MFQYEYCEIPKQPLDIVRSEMTEECGQRKNRLREAEN